MSDPEWLKAYERPITEDEREAINKVLGYQFTDEELRCWSGIVVRPGDHLKQVFWWLDWMPEHLRSARAVFWMIHHWEGYEGGEEAIFAEWKARG